MTSSCSRASCFSWMSSSFSMAIDASAESRVCPVAFCEYVLMRLRAEKDRSTEAVDTGMVTIKQVRAYSCGMLTDSPVLLRKVSRSLGLLPWKLLMLYITLSSALSLPMSNCAPLLSSRLRSSSSENVLCILYDFYPSMLLMLLFCFEYCPLCLVYIFIVLWTPCPGITDAN